MTTCSLEATMSLMSRSDGHVPKTSPAHSGTPTRAQEIDLCVLTAWGEGPCYLRQALERSSRFPPPQRQPAEPCRAQCGQVFAVGPQHRFAQHICLKLHQLVILCCRSVCMQLREVAPRGRGHRFKHIANLICDCLHRGSRQMCCAAGAG